MYSTNPIRSNFVVGLAVLGLRFVISIQLIPEQIRRIDPFTNTILRQCVVGMRGQIKSIS